jgi:bacteriocin-like protein
LEDEGKTMKRTKRARKRTETKKKVQETPVIDELKKLHDDNLQQVSGGWCGGGCGGSFRPPCY